MIWVAEDGSWGESAIRFIDTTGWDAVNFDNFSEMSDSDKFELSWQLPSTVDSLCAGLEAGLPTINFTLDVENGEVIVYTGATQLPLSGELISVDSIGEDDNGR
jgi:hypothetical protein